MFKIVVNFKWETLNQAWGPSKCRSYIHEGNTFHTLIMIGKICILIARDSYGRNLDSF